jgi:hypothetical protein
MLSILFVDVCSCIHVPSHVRILFVTQHPVRFGVTRDKSQDTQHTVRLCTQHSIKRHGWSLMLFWGQRESKYVTCYVTGKVYATATRPEHVTFDVTGHVYATAHINEQVCMLYKCYTRLPDDARAYGRVTITWQRPMRDSSSDHLVWGCTISTSDPACIHSGGGLRFRDCQKHYLFGQ